MQATQDDRRIAAAILDQVAARGPERSICPSDVARALDKDWRPLLSSVRRVAIGLAQEGRVDILRKGRRVAPEAVKGVIRLRAANSYAPSQGDAP